MYEIQKTFELFFSSWYIYLIFGMIFGSFLNVVVYRVPNGLSIVSPPSACPKCGYVIKWYDNIPVLSWLFLRGKCRKCKLPISVEYPIIELITGLITLGLFFYFGPSLKLIIYIPLAYTLLCITLVDFKTYSIPYGLNFTLLAIGSIGIIMNLFVADILPINWMHSLFGALTGFGILFLIQLVGKLIYKQDAMGGGDLYLLGFSGLVLGPKLTFLAFMFGSFIAVISYSVPSFINFLKKKKLAMEFKEIAEKYEAGLKLNTDDDLDIKGLKLQLLYNFRDENYKTLRDEIGEIVESKKIKNISILRLFFRYMATKDKYNAEEVIKLIDLKNPKLIDDIKTIISEDLIGYDSIKDNYELLLFNADQGFKVILIENKKFLLEELKIISVEKIKDKYNTLKNKTEKLKFILSYNRLFQLNGYTAEQKLISEYAEELIKDCDSKKAQTILSEMAFVYYKDFYFKESKESFENLYELMKSNPVEVNSVKALFNASLFRIYFYKERLAFGPYLAIGIMLSALYGGKIIDLYIKFLENMAI
ncbi:MAG: prepilin peptidase [Candidatus Delongbacteria bacterium]|jgi:leader peptidase (prepilin peptidase)/N-methyltransferase|nr:prepilin peptidase [Candidatus Delongbacteria bacterium]